MYNEVVDELGFLNDKRLINTMISRARTKVIIIGRFYVLIYYFILDYRAFTGNAEMFCKNGECKLIWKIYVQMCFKNQNFYPKNFDVSALLDMADEIHVDEIIDMENDCDPILKKLAELSFAEDDDLNFISNSRSKVILNQYLHDSEEYPGNSNLEKKICRVKISEGSAFAEQLPSGEAKLMVELFELKIPKLSLKNDDDDTFHEFRNSKDRNFAEQDDIVLVEFYELSVIKWPRVIKLLNRTWNFKGDLIIGRLDIIRKGIIIPIFNEQSKVFFMPKRNKNISKIPIYSHNRNSLSEKQEIVINALNAKKYLFVLKILAWSSKNDIPLGICVERIEAHQNLSSTFRTLSAWIYQGYKEKKGNAICKKFLETQQIQSNYDKDLTTLHAFTIDSENTEFRDDAFTFEKLDNGYKIGVHIADVAAHIEKDSAFDKYVKMRGISYFSRVGFVHHMLPKDVARVFSLDPHKKKDTLSLFFEYSNDEWRISRPYKTILISKKSYTYAEAQYEMEQSNSSNEQIDLNCMFQLVMKLRKNRLGISYHSNDNELNDWKYADAKNLVEELAIQTNYKIAQYLESHINNVIIRQQNAPFNLAFRKWQHLNREYNPTNFKLLNYTNSLDEMSTGNNTASTKIIRSNFHKIIELLRQNRVTEAIKHLTFTGNFPYQNLSLQSYTKLSKKSYYKLSTPGVFNGHNDLNLNIYTHFTSPIRRYFDIVVQRLLHSVLTNTNEIPYSLQELFKICQDANLKVNRSNIYRNNMDTFCLSICLQHRMASFDALIVDCDLQFMTFQLNHLNYLSHSSRSIKYAHLGLAENPKEDSDIIGLTWKQRMYDLKADYLRFNLKNQKILLKNEHNVSSIPNSIWLKFMECVKNNKLEKISELVHSFDAVTFNETSESEIPCATNWILEDIANKEEVEYFMNRHLITIQINLEKGDIMKVQMGLTVENGIIEPVPQYLKLSKNHGICIQHYREPISVFTDEKPDKADKNSYSTIEEYVSLWKPLLEWHAAINALNNPDALVLKNVEILWKTDEIAEIFIDPKVYTEINWEIENDDYVCIRYHNLYKDNKENLVNRMNLYFLNQKLNYKNYESKFKDFKSFSKKTMKEIFSNWDCDWNDIVWICHGKFINVFKSFKIKLNKVTQNFPKKLLHSKGVATVEVFKKYLFDRLKFKTLENLKFIQSPIIEKIVLGKKLGQKNNNHRVQCEDVGGLIDLNEIQRNAINNALNNKFTIIQGPPGTGKSLTCAHLIYNLLKNNDKEDVVMLCGPTNKSVDVMISK